MDYVLSTKGLKKKYGKKIVNNLSIDIKRGEIYALIGKNGAGKTTFMKMVTGLVLPDEGEFSIMSSSYGKKFPYECRFKVGALIEEAGVMKNLSGYENIRAKCICVGKNANGYVENILKMVSLEEAADKKVKNYSLGMKQRLGIALALVGDPELLILDEPINGLDPQGIAFVRELIIKLNKTGTTILISSHILEELSKVATKVGFVNSGELLEEISMAELREKCMNQEISIEDYYFKMIGE